MEKENWILFIKEWKFCLAIGPLASLERFGEEDLVFKNWNADNVHKWLILRAEIVCSVLGSNENKSICSQNLLTFSRVISYIHLCIGFQAWFSRVLSIKNKKVTLATLDSLWQKDCQISVKFWIFNDPIHKKEPVFQSNSTRKERWGQQPCCVMEKENLILFIKAWKLGNWSTG